MESNNNQRPKSWIDLILDGIHADNDETERAMKILEDTALANIINKRHGGVLKTCPHGYTDTQNCEECRHKWRE